MTTNLTLRHIIDNRAAHMAELTLRQAIMRDDIMGSSSESSGGYRIDDRPWQELPEPSKLAILQDAVDWSGITNRGRATNLLSEIDPGKITDAQRTRLIDTAAQSSYKAMLQKAASRGGGQDKNKGMER